MLGQAFDDVLMAAQAGAGWAFTRLYEDLAGVVTGYLRQQGAWEPDDVASETFLHVFSGIGTFEGDEEAFRSWVFTIAHRRLVDERRKVGRRPEVAPVDDAEAQPDAGPGPDHTVVDEARWEELEQHLAVLTPLQRDVVLLRVVAGLTVDETAEIVDRSPDAVRQLQHRGLRALEEDLLTGGADDVVTGGAAAADR